MEKNNFFQTVKRFVKSGFFWFGMLFLALAMGKYASENVTVSNSVDGRELPIYCVETDEKKVALSFDAACGGGNLR